MITDQAPDITLSTDVNQPVGLSDLIQLGTDPPLYALRFETMKALSAPLCGAPSPRYREHRSR